MTPRQKVLFMIQRLTGRAQDWAAAGWRQGGAMVMHYTAFLEEFTAVFAHPDDGQFSGQKLMHLQQGQDSVSDYAIRLRILTASSGWNQSALLQHFHYEFSAELQKDIAC